MVDWIYKRYKSWYKSWGGLYRSASQHCACEASNFPIASPEITKFYYWRILNLLHHLEKQFRPKLKNRNKKWLAQSPWPECTTLLWVQTRDSCDDLEGYANINTSGQRIMEGADGSVREVNKWRSYHGAGRVSFVGVSILYSFEYSFCYNNSSQRIRKLYIFVSHFLDLEPTRWFY